MTEDQGTILIVEDDPRMQKVLHRIFHDEGYRIEIASDGKSVVDFFVPIPRSRSCWIYSAAAVRTRCLQAHESDSPDTPVLILSAVSEVVDKVLLLELGAEDYITKPFSPRELLARVQRSIRRRRSMPQFLVTYNFGNCEIDFLKMTAKKDEKHRTLTAHEFKLLRVFTENAERVLSREDC